MCGLSWEATLMIKFDASRQTVTVVCLKCQRKFTMSASQFLHTPKRGALLCPKCKKEAVKK